MNPWSRVANAQHKSLAELRDWVRSRMMATEVSPYTLTTESMSLKYTKSMRLKYEPASEPLHIYV